MTDNLQHPKHWPAWIAIFLLRCLALLPLDFLLLLGKAIGHLLAKVPNERQLICRANIELCFSELTPAARDKLIIDTITSSVLGLLETAYSWWANDNELQTRVDYEGLELIAAAQQQGRGVLLIGSHFTTLDLAGRMLRLKVDVDSSYQKQNNPVFDHCILQYRLKRFTNMVEKTEMRRLIRIIKSGRVMWYAADQDFGRKHSVFAPFFGIPAATINTLGSLLKLTGAKPLYFSHYRIHRDGKTRYLMRITDPFGEQLGSDDVANATLLNQVIADAIRIAPEQYMWVHRRFKTRPHPDDPKPYPQRKKKRKKNT